MFRRFFWPVLTLALCLTMAWLAPVQAGELANKSKCYLNCVDEEKAKSLATIGSGLAIMEKCRQKCAMTNLATRTTPHEKCIHACYQKLWDCQKVCFKGPKPTWEPCLEDCKNKYLSCIDACGYPK